MIYQRVHSATLAIAQQHERMMEEMEKNSQVCLPASRRSQQSLIQLQLVQLQEQLATHENTSSKKELYKASFLYLLNAVFVV